MNNKAKNIVKMMAVLMGLFVCGSMLAQNGNVREETARQVGLNFLRLKDENPRSNLQLTRVDAVQYPNLYVYNTSENGFIVVASDNRMEPILAYSDEGTFDKDDVAPGANFWFEMYEYAIDSIVRNNVRDVDETITRKWEDLANGIFLEPERNGNYPSSYGPLIGTHWGQSGIYNQMCPWSSNGSRAVTGCTATALAQVLYYYHVNIPQRAIWYSFRHNGSSTLNLVGANGNTYQSQPVNGCNLPERNAYNIGGWNSFSGNIRIAKIMLDCGLAVDMRYGLNASGAWNASSYACPGESSAESALKKYFGFPRAEGFVRSNYNLTNWNELLLENIVNNNPIIYSGQKINGGSHTFICDGYYYDWFHFNYGWCGSSDGYYLITNPQEYSLYQNAVVAAPTDLVIWNDEIPFGEQILDRVWCGEGIYVKYDDHYYNSDNIIMYNLPGYYSLRNHCESTGKTLIWNVQVLPGIENDEYATICKKSKYHNTFHYSYSGTHCKADFNLSSEQTNFDGTIDFSAPILDDNGTIRGTCILHLTTSGEVTEITMDPVSMTYCEFKNNHNGVYNWTIPGVVNPIKCYSSGHYEYTVGVNNPPYECQTVYSFDLSIEMPAIIKDTTLTVCTNDFYLTWLPPDETIQQHFLVAEQAYGMYEVETLADNCNKMYRFHCNYVAKDTIPEEVFKCMEDLPFVWHGRTIPKRGPGFYNDYSPVTELKDPNDPTQCDKVYLLYLTITEDCCKPDPECIKDKITGGNKSTPSNMEVIYYGLKHYYEYRDATNKFLFNVFNGIPWPSIEDRNTFWNLFQSLLDSNTGMMTEQAMQQLIDTNPYDYISEDYITNLVERYNRSVMYWNEGQYSVWYLPQGYNPDNFIEYDTASMNKAYEAYDYAIAHGFNDVKAMYDNAYELLAAEVDNIQSAVCAKVTVQFNQKMTMTREAFNGTLQIFNGHESIPMQDIMVDFRIEDLQGNDCTNLFQINTLSLDQITGISGDGSLAAQTNGTALVQFIPTKNAAPTEPKVYSFGGSFSFIDPFTGEGLTYPLHPVDITVNPSPDLNIDIFMQRDIIGDDALTTDVVEPTVPAELGVIIHNQGAGEAKNVTLETAEPQIIDNEKGLAIDFAMYGASFNGSPRQLGLMEIPFGNIGSGQTAVGEWLFTSSLLGHFVSYEAHVIHNSSYGNQDLSLVSHLAIHELIHPIYAYGTLDDGINDFLVNDIPDAYDTPDTIYFSHGGKTSVGVVDGISYDHLVSPSDTVVTLTVVPSRVGWNYGVTDDPGMNQYNIVSCIRNNDNQVIPLNNVWLTFVTIPDGGDPVYENKLHIVDTLSVQQSTTYTLVFRRKPSNLRIFNGNVDEYWSNASNWEGNVMPQDDDEVLINGICLLDEDVEVFSLTVAENQSLTIPAGRILTTSGTLTSEATSRLVIQDGGQLVHKNVGVQATVQKDIEPYTNNYDGYYLIATPLAGFTAPASVVNMLSNDYDLYYFDQSQELEWINYEGANGNYELVPGKGYLYANSEGVVLEFAGELRSGATTLTVPLIYTEGAGFIGFNLVGNPFVYNLTTYASHNVAEGCYRMNEAKDDLMVSEISESNPLKPAEGFFVKATDEGAYITFNPQMTSMAPRGSINVELSDNGLLIDRLIVKTDEGRSLEKFNLKATRSKLFAQDKRHEYAIVPCESHEQPVSFKAAKNGTYTVNVNADGMEFYYLHLIDNLTGNDVNLLSEPSYTFEARTTDYASRFLLRFIPKDGPSTGSGTENFAFNFNGTWIIANEGDATLQVVDMMGHVLSSERINGTCEKQMDAAAGVYLLRLINGNNVKVQKIVVK